MYKRKGLTSMRNHKLPKNIYFEKICYMFHEIMMS